jgi:hypothetical protein
VKRTMLITRMPKWPMPDLLPFSTFYSYDSSFEQIYGCNFTRPVPQPPHAQVEHEPAIIQ